MSIFSTFETIVEQALTWFVEKVDGPLWTLR